MGYGEFSGIKYIIVSTYGLESAKLRKCHAKLLTMEIHLSMHDFFQREWIRALASKTKLSKKQNLQKLLNVKDIKE